MENEFKECESCAKKPGSPTLCGSCLHNRSLVTKLKQEKFKFEKTLEIMKELLNLNEIF